MLVSDILKVKGDRVATIHPHSTIIIALEELQALNIGALVVTRDDKAVLGILSERDVVRHLAREGAKLLDRTVGEVMTQPVVTCAPEDTVAKVMAEMTRSRFRHMPVIKDGRLCGIVSIGDVVKDRLDQVEAEAGELRNAIVGGYSATSAGAD